MPEAPLTPDRRRVDPGHGLGAPSRAVFVELGLVTCFSFLRGASDAVDLVTQARALGYDAIGIADVNSMAGVVRLHTEAKTLGLRPVIGCRIETVEGLVFLAYPGTRAAYGRLCRLLSRGNLRPESEKGKCALSFADLTDGVTYYYRVLATNNIGSSVYSNVVSSTQDTALPNLAITSPASGISTATNTVWFTPPLAP